MAVQALQQNANNMARQSVFTVIAVVLSAAACEAVSTRQLQAVDAVKQVSISYNRSVTGGDPLGKLQFNDTRLADTSGGLDPSQVQCRPGISLLMYKALVIHYSDRCFACLPDVALKVQGSRVALRVLCTVALLDTR